MALTLLAFAVCAAAPLGCTEATPSWVEESSDGPVCNGCNLLLISIDTLRADRLGAYGYERPTSPNLDRLAARSVVFRDVIAQASTTAPSHRSMLSGRHVFEHQNDVEDIPLLAELLSGAGYRTAAFVDGAQMNAEFGMSKGFDLYYDSGVYLDGVAQVGGGLAVLKPAFRAWLASAAYSRFFALLHTYDVHCPYTPPKPFRSMFVEEGFEPAFEVDGKCGYLYFNELDLGPRDHEYISALYDGGVRYTDEMLAGIFEAIERLNLDDRTVIIVTSDHGEALGERGFVGHNHVYDVQLRVPLILHLPGRSGVVVEDPAQLIDIVPTVLGLLGIAPPKDISGIDLRRAIQRSRGSERLRLGQSGFSHTVRLDKRWSLVLDQGKPTGLYDLDADPTEENDLLDEEPDVAAKLLEGFESFPRTQEPLRGIRDDIPESLRDQLRALGYEIE